MLCKGSLPRNTRFFSLTALMRMRYQAVGDNNNNSLLELSCSYKKNWINEYFTMDRIKL
jgi:hypothetical protein